MVQARLSSEEHSSINQESTGTFQSPDAGETKRLEIDLGCCECGEESTVGAHYILQSKVVSYYWCNKHWSKHKYQNDGRFNVEKRMEQYE